YVKTLPPDCVLEQSLAPGECVKSGRIIYLTINASHSPTITIPDVIDNSSMREAMAKLTAMGFKLGTPKFIPGEKDWVYGIMVRGKNVGTGEKVSIEDSLVVLVGNGSRDMSEEVDYVEPVYPELEENGEEIDDFQEVAPASAPVSSNNSDSRNGEKAVENKPEKKN
ncbi:MAG TPA: penicillin-binding protein, partial [Prevotella sp.]